VKTSETRKQRQRQATSVKICASTAKGSIISRMSAVPEYKTINPAQMAEEKNTG
jgi:hypothetical protein